MKERQEPFILPKRLENVVELEKPSVSLTVKLPFCRYEFTDKYYRQGMHTDMIYAFTSFLRDLKPQYRNNLLIQGRILNKKTWDELQEHPAYLFFYYGRDRRRYDFTRWQVIEILMPKNTKLTQKQVDRYAGLDFTPDSLSKELGFKTGWYPASYLLKRGNGEDEEGETLLPYLGGVNQFKIGSNELKPGIVRMVALQMALHFQEMAGMIAEYVQDGVSDEILEKSAKIFKIK